ncbi:partial 5-methylthioadenosine/S-adenosylhomocysteine deaminase, partial [Anaerolineae bacterium]
MTSIYLRGGIVVPLDGQHDWFDPGVVVFEKGQITFVGPAASAPPPTEGAVVHDCADRIIMPGLVNAHTHTGMNYFRNLLEDLTSSDWFAREQVAEKYLTREDIYWAALLGAYEMLRQGITTIADRFGNMDVVVAALEHAGIRATIAPSLVDRDAPTRQRLALDLLERYGARGDGLIRVGLGP